MNRRAFLLSTAAAAAIAFDREKALWTPGKLISIPKPLPVATPAFFNLGDMITFEGLYAAPGVLQKFIVTAAGKSFDDIRFRFFDPSAAPHPAVTAWRRQRRAHPAAAHLLE